MDKKEKMFSLVDQWRKSGLTRKTFAQQHGIHTPSFDYWCKKQYNEVCSRMGQLLWTVQVVGIEPNLSTASQTLGHVGTKTAQALQNESEQGLRLAETG